MPHTFRDARDLADDVRRAFEELEHHAGVQGISGECSPAVDVYETGDTIEIVIDLPGVPDDAVRLLVKGGTVLIVGEKTATFCPATDATFHLVERGFGRFARAIRLPAAVNASRATAILTHGELRLILPRVDDRRNREIAVPVRRIDSSA
jgi:HSP20 family protein